ncbi:hypothetical protein ETU37_01980 [Nocardioides iriomotensis]|uniref:DUF402 domain-containing protein n=2 Tax=Nocardioides iriomotensis TaxID=715784 RepID=A0A4Q5JA68_9ACTN|nr:hypothetical protein ETU37_01980 [Nocardioides iriomotensis]
MLDVPGHSWAWLVAAGTRRERPASGRTDLIGSDELWVTVPGAWWVLCAHTDSAGSLTGYLVHAAAPFDPPVNPLEITWVDLALDFEVQGDELLLHDETEFHDQAAPWATPTMSCVERGRASRLSPRGSPPANGTSTAHSSSGSTPSSRESRANPGRANDTSMSGRGL